MEIMSFLAYSIALGIAAVIPGPGVAAIVSRSLGAGYHRTIPMVFGLILGDVVYLCLAIGGLSVLAQTFSGIFTIIRFAGAAYLLWLAWKFWTSGIELEKIEKSSGKRDNWQAFLGGFAVTLGNPKTVVFYMALLPTVVDLAQVDMASLATLIVLTVLVLLVTILPYAALASYARDALQQPGALKVLNRTAASALGLTACWIVVRQQ